MLWVKEKRKFMDSVILKNLPFQIDLPELMRQMRIKENSSYVVQLEHLVDQAVTIANPKAIYRLAFIEEKGDDYVVVDGVRLASRVLRVNLADAQRLFAYVTTCGVELEEWAHQIEDMLQRFWAEAINEMVLHSAGLALREHLFHVYQIGNGSTMNPGSLADWPLAEQRKLFSLLGNTADTIGVQLTDSLLMLPTKSVSGILFPTEETFASCQLCPRDPCPNRRAPYDQDLFDKKYRLVTAS